MNRTTTLKQGQTTSRARKQPYLYVHSSGPVGQTSGNSSAPSSKTMVKRSTNSAESMPSHWRKAVA